MARIKRTPEERKAYEKQWKEQNRAKMREYARKYRQNHRDMPHHLMRKYGITTDDKEMMYKDQQGLCAVCKQPLKGCWDRDSCVDHCHVTKKVRGIVHWYCNILIGVMESKPLLLSDIQAYLDVTRDAIVRTQGNENLESVAEMPTPELTLVQ